MSDDTTVLLEEKSYIVEMDHPTQENVQEEPTGDYEEDHFEVVVEVESGPYRFLRNWNSVGVWMCAVYNFCVLLLLITVYVYKRKN
ncbi:uncharacterized protein [Drosophila bipectinata]|uniref:uncharacterized protein n=1 Tax=Drosophila bipectinata TaxID=42026 RepID=UPI001C8A854F|nr:uncharacterized protein LOC108132220 [Drosophila bipectinata]